MTKDVIKRQRETSYKYKDEPTKDKDGQTVPLMNVKKQTNNQRYQKTARKKSYKIQRRTLKRQKDKDPQTHKRQRPGDLYLAVLLGGFLPIVGVLST